MAEMDQETTADTAYVDIDSESVSPPSLLMWLIVGIFLLTVVGATGSVIVFRNILRPGQQQRVINMLPFMEAFLSRNPGAGAALPTAIPTYSSGLSSDHLLNIVLVSPTPETIPTITVQPPTLTSLALATSTATPTLEPTNTLTSTSTTEAPILPSATPNAAPPTANLYGFTYTRQTWNNCGPATITMGLSYFGWREDQGFAASFLKPDEEDKNVTPYEMVTFVNEQSGIRAITRMGGTLDLLKMLMAGLSQNTSITQLDLSHNKISNHGVRMLATMLMNPNCVLARLSLADNQIHVEGGRYLGRGLRENSSLLELNVRLNRLTDEGLRMLLEG